MQLSGGQGARPERGRPSSRAHSPTEPRGTYAAMHLDPERGSAARGVRSVPPLHHRSTGSKAVTPPRPAFDRTSMNPSAGISDPSLSEHAPSASRRRRESARRRSRQYFCSFSRRSGRTLDGRQSTGPRQYWRGGARRVRRARIPFPSPPPFRRLDGQVERAADLRVHSAILGSSWRGSQVIRLRSSSTREPRARSLDLFVEGRSNRAHTAPRASLREACAFEPTTLPRLRCHEHPTVHRLRARGAAGHTLRIPGSPTAAALRLAVP